MIEITVSGNTYDEAYAEGMNQLGVSKDAIEVEELSSAHDDILPGAEPLPGVTLRFRVREDVLLEEARRHLQNMLSLIGTKCTVEILARRRGPTLNIVAGEDGSLVIGKNGQNLDALQYLVNRITVKSNRDLAPIMVDSEGYREKRISKLEEVARRTAQRVMRSGREMALEPMPASERKIIHLAVRDMKGVHSISRGEEGERRVVITPAQGEAPPPNVIRGRVSRPPDDRPRQERRDSGQERRREHGGPRPDQGVRREGGGGGRRRRGGRNRGGSSQQGGGRPPRQQSNNSPPPPADDSVDDDSRFNR
jgi:spoIIIJ-associated protein